MIWLKWSAISLGLLILIVASVAWYGAARWARATRALEAQLENARYVAGVGIVHPAMLGLFSLADLRGGADMAQGELMRSFAEAAWYPAALLPSQGVRFKAASRLARHDHPASLRVLCGSRVLAL